VVGVLSDGRVALQWDHGPFAVVARDAPQVLYEELGLDRKPAWVSVVYDDGAILQAYDFYEATDVFFAPWRGTTLDMENRVRISTSTAERGLPAYWRHGSVLVWQTESNVWRSFDVETGSEKLFSRRVRRDEGRHVLAFDGETVVFDKSACDLATGEALPRTPPSGVIAVRNRMVYWIRGDRPRVHHGKPTDQGVFSLEASDLTAPERAGLYLLDLRPGELARPPRRYPLAPLRNFPHIIREDALIIWDGERWQRLPWLERLDDD
jgi:hypothetical protein